MTHSTPSIDMKAHIVFSLALSFGLIAVSSALAATDTWTGGGSPDGNWGNAANWDNAPAAGDFLSFDNGGGAQPLTTNNLATGTIFGNITFNSGTVSYTNGGNGIVLADVSESTSGNSGALFGGSISNFSANAQTLNLPVTIQAGNHTITTISGAGQLNISGVSSRNNGGTVQFFTSGGSINTTGSGLANDGSSGGGILGGWAVIGPGNNAGNWATINGSGNVVAYSGYTSESGSFTTASGGNFKVTQNNTTTKITQASGSFVDMNTLLWTPSSSHGETIQANTAADPIRLGANGGIMNIDGNSQTLTIGGGSTYGLTAGGPNANTPGEMTLSQLGSGSGHLVINCVIQDNGSGSVTVNQLGSINYNFANTYSGGTYLNYGEGYLQSGANFGSGPIHVNPGARADFGGNNTTTFANNLFIAGYGSYEAGSDNPAAIKGTYDGTFSGTVTLMSSAQIDPNAGSSPNTCTFSGLVTGTGSLTIGGGNSGIVAGTATFGGTNNYSGDAIIDATANNNGGAGFKISAGKNNILQIGGNVNLIGGSSGVATFDLNGTTQTINGLTNTSGTAANAIVKSSAAGGLLVVGNNNTTSTFGGVIENSGGTLALTKIGSGVLTLTGANIYTGTTTISNGTLSLSGSLANTAQILVSSGATFDVSPLGTITLGGGQSLTGGGMVNGSVNTASGSVIGPVINGIQISGNLTLNTGNSCSFNLYSTTNNPANDQITVGGNLNLAGATIQINAATLQQGRYRLILYPPGSESGSAAANLVLSYVPSGVTVALDDSIAGEIDLLVTPGVPETLTWAGDGTQNIWDVATTADWTTNGAGSFVFTNGALAVFNDSGSKSPAVNISATVQPLSLLISNNTGTYTFSGGGSIAGGTGLVKKGSGALILNDTGGDSFGGGMLVQGGSLNLSDTGVNLSGNIAVTNSSLTLANNGTMSGNLIVQNGGTVLLDQSATITGNISISNSALVQVGANDANGSLPSGNVNNYGTLIFNNTDDITVANAIAGSGILIKTNTDALTLTADNSSWTGSALVSEGTLKVGAVNAIGNGSTPITVMSGATLDFNGVANNLLSVTVSGAGVGGNGAIVDSGADVYPVVTNITLAGNTVIGGTGRWDLRSLGGTTGNPAAATLGTGGQPYNLTKVGANFIGIVAATVDPNLANIDLQGGTLDIEGNTTGLGNPTNTLTVENGATLFFYQPTNKLNKVFVMQDGSTFDNSSGATAVIGPVLLNTNASGGPADVTFDCGGSSLAFSNVISGPGNLNKSGGGSYLYLSATNTYTGNTFVTAGWIALVGNGSIAGSSNIVLDYTKVDATFRTDKTFNLASGQTLSGTNSGIQGFLITSPGSTIMPGGIGYVDTLTVSSNATLAGNLIMDIDKSNATNDVLAVTAGRSITYGGTLSLSNLTAALASGDSFKLFNAASYSGTFANITPAAPGTGLVWDASSLTNNGVLNVINAVNSNPTNLTAVVTGKQLTLSWPTDHIGWYLQSQTNALSTGLGTNWSDVPGATSVNSVNVTLDPANGSVFFRMSLNP